MMITAHGTVDNAVEALKTGAFDYLTKPFDQDEVRRSSRRRCDARPRRAPRRRATTARRRRRARASASSARAPAIIELYAILERVADTPTTVLITGESGTGKELVARALHENSSRKDKPFIKVNCAAIPKELDRESSSSATSAAPSPARSRRKPGRFELATGGTLFLDEIGEIPVEMQVKLLRALQESEFERVGGIKTIRVDVRLVAATNRDLEEARSPRARSARTSSTGSTSCRFACPRCASARRDIPLLVEHFLDEVQRAPEEERRRASSPRRSSGSSAYAWPGNIRELENVHRARGALLRRADAPRRGPAGEVRGGAGARRGARVAPASPPSRATRARRGRTASRSR